MSNRALTWAFDTDVKPAGAKFVLVALADFADEANSCYPSQSRLASMTGQARESVLRHLKTLEAGAYIHRSRRSSSDGYRITDRFVLNVGGDVAMLESAYVTNCLVGKNTVPKLQTRSKKPRNRHSNPQEPLLNPQQDMSEVAPQPADDASRLLDFLDSKIQANGAKVPTRSKKNLDAARLILTVDEYTPDQVASLITFATSNEFWRSNILSMSKLRDKADTLRLQLQRGTSTDKGAQILRTEMERAQAADAARGTQPKEDQYRDLGF